MKITILNGDQGKNEFQFTKNLNRYLIPYQEEHSINVFELKKMDLNYCIGCWSCWWKTPGLCTHKDDGAEIFRSVINSDFFIFASPLIGGFTSSELKKITDRLIVLVHPYVEMRKGESHHKKRYATYPDFGLIVEREKTTDQDDLEIVNSIYDRLGINFHAEKRFSEVVNENVEWKIAGLNDLLKKKEATV